jgi:predicted site-specific integrase-resolvase
METLKIDRTKLQTIANYAKAQGVTRQTVYLWAKDGKVKIVVIDGCMFVEKQ